ncbi:MAG TPA: succinate dehydrogenase, partial [Ramlibacter sp.]|nr:succinate dehydrogenase [Ramlibacter sp.]
AESGGRGRRAGAMRSARNHRAYRAFLGHRLSGIALGLFLPMHFYVLGTALENVDRFDRLIKLADMGAFKFAEWGLVILLSVHMCFGLRLLALELLPWSSTRNARLSWITWGGVLSFAVGLVFAVGVM